MLVHRGTCAYCSWLNAIEQLQCAHTALPRALDCSGQPGGPPAGDGCLLSVPFCCCLSVSWAFPSPAGQPGGPAAGGVWLGHSLHRAAHRRTGQVRTQRSYMHSCAAFSYLAAVGAHGLLIRCTPGVLLHFFAAACCPAAACCVLTARLVIAALTSRLRCRHLPPCDHMLRGPLQTISHLCKHLVRSAGPTARCSARSWALRRLCPPAAAKAACRPACSAHCWISSMAGRSTPGAWWWSDVTPAGAAAVHPLRRRRKWQQQPVSQFDQLGTAAAVHAPHRQRQQMAMQQAHPSPLHSHVITGGT